ncbi:MAG: class I SAM-dependent RNA methyltransferase [Deltaproteobacteria bacterium]|nr:class I SAM-dependent RNA methyltransferase [Deltaproteobacteria bacterium]
MMLRMLTIGAERQGRSAGGKRADGGTVKAGERLTITIGDVAFGGDGVGRAGERVVFVPFVCDGDEAEVEIIEVKKRYARGRVVRLLAPADRRVEPPCPYYTRCGGCRMQHIAYPHQLELKGRQVRETFARIARLPALSVLPVIASPQPFGYRGKAEFHLAGGRGSARRIGLMALASHDLVEVERCAIVAESINRKYGALRETLRQGLLRHPGERRVFWSDGPEESSAPGKTEEPATGDVTRIVLEKRLTVSREGFFQANEALVGELVAQVLEMAALTGGETVVDAYGGCGLFSLFLAPRAGRLFGIEGDREAVRCAGINLQRAGFADATFFQGDVGAVMAKELVLPGKKADVVILDPPRDGCGDGVLSAVAALEPQRIVYVSCNPATQARDCLQLAELGYQLQRLQPLDMFPQTAHIECVALLTPVS